VGLAGIEPATSPLSGVRSNRLSYSPVCERTRLPLGAAIGRTLDDGYTDGLVAVSTIAEAVTG
jgi:hypothetical protein